MSIDNELKKREILRMSNEESHKLTLECIRSALIYLMGTKSYDKITITEIINRSGVSRAAFYRNYSSKDEVLQDEMNEVRKKLQEIFSNSLLDNNPREWIIEFFNEIKKNKRKISFLLKANLDYEKIFDHLEIESQNTTPLIRYKTAIYLSSLWVVVKLWIDNQFRETPQELADFILDIFANPKKPLSD